VPTPLVNRSLSVLMTPTPSQSDQQASDLTAHQMSPLHSLLLLLLVVLGLLLLVVQLVLLTMRWQPLLLACIPSPPHAHTASAHATCLHRNDDDATGRDDVPYLRVMSDSPQQRTSCDPSAVVPSPLVVTIHTEFDGRESTPSPRTSVEALRELVSEEPAAAYLHTRTHTRARTGARMHTCMRTCLCIRPTSARSR
jgi:hypothetical protein